MNHTDKTARLAHANALIRVISAHGRRFFWNEEAQRVASLELDPRGRVWFIDDYTGKRIYTQKTTFTNKWRGFSHGGTLRDLVEAMADYIRTSQQINRHCIAPTRSMDGGSDMWGYGPEACQAVRAEAFTLPILTPATTSPT